VSSGSVCVRPDPQINSSWICRQDFSKAAESGLLSTQYKNEAPSASPEGQRWCLITVSLIEVTFYISALHQQPPAMGAMSLGVIAAVQHLYFVIAAPAVFLPLGIILRGSDVLPKLVGYLAIALPILFFAFGQFMAVRNNLTGLAIFLIDSLELASADSKELRSGRILENR
jgi:hypothetical protein